jgi:Domain of unknown function (DUF5597)/Beta-galactosidase
MKRSPALSLLFLALGATALAAPQLPHLEQRGAATQLIVDDQPWLIIGGEVANTASSSLPYMETVWPRLARLNLNTVLVPVAWAWVEPEENHFDFTLVDGLLAGARRNHQRIGFLWFGSWKNSVSSFAPAWVKTDQARFPRVQLAGGRSVEILSPFSEALLAADTRAYAKFLAHLAQTDSTHTVLMIQLQNEVGVLGATRDHSPQADAAFAAAVPAELASYLTQHRGRLAPALAQRWTAAGARTAGTWTELFGPGAATDELFMAWHYARFMGRMAAAGKGAYALPVFTNTWIVQPEDQAPGDYPSGGPQPLTLDVWKAGAPAIDLNCPDIYLPNFTDQVAAFHRADNPLFVPESRGDAAGVANAFYAIGAHASLGYSPFGIDDAGRLLVLRPAPGDPKPTDLETLPLARGYAVLRDLAPLILDHETTGTLGAAWLNKGSPSQSVALGNYTLNVELRRSSRDQSVLADLGYALIIALSSDEFLVAASDVQITFTPRTPGAPMAGIADAETGAVVDGRWTPGRKLNGDDILLNYHLAQQAELNQSGSGLRFGPDGPTIQRVKLYRYR